MNMKFVRFDITIYKNIIIRASRPLRPNLCLLQARFFSSCYTFITHLHYCSTSSASHHTPSLLSSLFLSCPLPRVLLVNPSKKKSFPNILYIQLSLSTFHFSCSSNFLTSLPCKSSPCCTFFVDFPSSLRNNS